MLLSNIILNELGINSEEFFYSTKVLLYKRNEPEPFGQVVLIDGHYQLTVGYVEEDHSRKHVIK